MYNDLSFELERKHDKSWRSFGTTSREESTAAIVVRCKNKVERDEWLGTINPRIRYYNDIANRLANPLKNKRLNIKNDL